MTNRMQCSRLRSTAAWVVFAGFAGSGCAAHAQASSHGPAAVANAQKATPSPSPDASSEETAHLRRVLHDGKADSRARVSALRTLCLLEGRGEVAELAALLVPAEPSELREAAAEALGTLGGPDARRTLQDQLGQEENLAVREALQASLTKMEP